jgi:amino acid transporter
LLSVSAVKHRPSNASEVLEVKVITLVGLIIFGIVIDLGGGPNHQFIGGRHWREEPFNDTFLGLQPVAKARFLGFWSVFTKVCLAL